MMDLLVPAVQVVCALGLVYGFIVVMLHADCVDTIGSRGDLSDGLEIKLVRDDSTRRSGVAADSDARKHRSRVATHVD
ncbi:MAG TPA: hypothetical protein VFI62_05455 [Burkholderiales bacterium]|jgi:hypothetical protein|nr:hypothetical protein [Burkholderiales bacterium]